MRILLLADIAIGRRIYLSGIRSEATSGTICKIDNEKYHIAWDDGTPNSLISIDKQPFNLIQIDETEQLSGQKPRRRL